MGSKKKAELSLMASIDSDEEWQELIRGKEVEFRKFLKLVISSLVFDITQFRLRRQISNI